MAEGIFPGLENFAKESAKAKAKQEAYDKIEKEGKDNGES